MLRGMAAAGERANVWLKATDPEVEGARLDDHEVQRRPDRSLLPILYYGHRWAFSHTYLERDVKRDTETPWLVFVDQGLV